MPANKQLRIETEPAYSPKEWVAYKLEGFAIRQAERDAKRARTSRRRKPRRSAAVNALPAQTAFPISEGYRKPTGNAEA